jgi:hypothetical protein
VRKEHPALRARVLLAALASLADGCSGYETARPKPGLHVARVARTVQLHATSLIRVHTGNDSVVTTPEHPFARPSSGWTRATDLATGDELVSASEKSDVTIQSLERLQVESTPVYNLSVEPGRAYFVGSSALLVHNTDCRSRRREPLLVNDMPEFTRHCGFCSLAALVDMSVAELTDTRDIPPTNDGLSPSQFQRLLERAGAISPGTRATVWKQPAGGNAATHPAQALEQFIHDEHSDTNTFAIVYARPDREELPRGSGRFQTVMTMHAITAVREDDGSTIYIDFQARPPKTSRTLNPNIDTLAVWRTTTDYKYNRHMLNALRYGRQVPIIL